MGHAIPVCSTRVPVDYNSQWSSWRLVQVKIPKLNELPYQFYFCNLPLSASAPCHDRMEANHIRTVGTLLNLMQLHVQGAEKLGIPTLSLMFVDVRLEYTTRILRKGRSIRRFECQPPPPSFFSSFHPISH